VLFTNEEVKLIDRETSEVLKRGYFDGKFWRLKFELPHSRKDKTVKDSLLKYLRVLKRRANFLNDNGIEIGGSKQRKIEKSQTNDPQIGESEQEASSSNKYNEREQHEKGETDDETNQFNSVDLERINKSRVRCLKECLGLLWHIRLNHASKMYLEMAAKILPKLRGVKFTNKILECVDCLLAKARRKPCNETHVIE